MHSKDWIPEFKSLFKKELENFIKFIVKLYMSF